MFLQRLPSSVILIKSSCVNICIYISFRLELIPPRGGVSRSDLSSPLLSVTCMFFLETERLNVLLYHVFPSLLLLSSTVVSIDLYRLHSFHGVFVLSSHHILFF